MSNEQEDNFSAAREFIKSIPEEQMTPIHVKHTFWDVKVGDTVVRMLAGVVRMELVVTNVEERLIHVGDAATGVGGWTFDRSTGIEVDEELGWGIDTGVSGSYLIKE